MRHSRIWVCVYLLSSAYFWYIWRRYVHDSSKSYIRANEWYTRTSEMERIHENPQCVVVCRPSHEIPSQMLDNVSTTSSEERKKEKNRGEVNTRLHSTRAKAQQTQQQKVICLSSSWHVHSDFARTPKPKYDSTVWCFLSSDFSRHFFGRSL